MELLWVLNEIMLAQHFAQCLAASRDLVSDSYCGSADGDNYCCYISNGTKNHCTSESGSLEAWVGNEVYTQPEHMLQTTQKVALSQNNCEL